MNWYAVTEQDVRTLERVAQELEQTALVFERLERAMSSSAASTQRFHDLSSDLRDVIASTYDTPIDQPKSLAGEIE